MVLNMPSEVKKRYKRQMEIMVERAGLYLDGILKKTLFFINTCKIDGKIYHYVNMRSKKFGTSILLNKALCGP
ncbi:hypothetical protein DBR19_19680 [Aeromonas sp. HMWF014]|nr:hypothetical protein DBR19_19680 [Aeromonas sp. HMWF014]